MADMSWGGSKSTEMQTTIKITVCAHGVDLRFAKCLMCEDQAFHAAKQPIAEIHNAVTGETPWCSNCEKLRGIIDWMLQYVHPSHRSTILGKIQECQLEEGIRYPAHDMAKALREIGAMIPSATGGTFENDPPGAIADALRRALDVNGSEEKK